MSDRTPGRERGSASLEQADTPEKEQEKERFGSRGADERRDLSPSLSLPAEMAWGLVPTDSELVLAVQAALAEKGLQLVMVCDPVKITTLPDQPRESYRVRADQAWRLEIQPLDGAQASA